MKERINMKDMKIVFEKPKRRIYCKDKYDGVKHIRKFIRNTKLNELIELIVSCKRISRKRLISAVSGKNGKVCVNCEELKTRLSELKSEYDLLFDKLMKCELELDRINNRINEKKLRERTLGLE